MEKIDLTPNINDSPALKAKVNAIFDSNLMATDGQFWETCSECGDQGWIVEPTCCLRFDLSGGCCGCPDPTQVQCRCGR
ncbi:hypothetical protein [Leptospira sp. GIMC2001]|uniref:hypothetical protein n=1 Tax=Leptospira sp. GIMC2001 TaxID=1513297 RepID=UPI002349A087|nr:hypothetical protein [Leptospira sp. GIMC2001]WCL51487.1 hypothetical protein O4O04_19930 [Leptospira sp. GIMC2001]